MSLIVDTMQVASERQTERRQHVFMSADAICVT